MLAQRLLFGRDKLITDGLVSRWFFGPSDGNDQIGGNNATLSGTPTWGDGPHNTGIILNGSSQYGTVNDAANLTPGSDFSFSFWVDLAGYSNSYNGYYGGIVVAKDYGAASYREYSIAITGTSSAYTTLEFYLFSNNSTYTLNSWTKSFSLNTPYFIVIKRTEGVVYMSVNIVNTFSQANTRTVQNTTSAVEIGRRYNATYSFYLKGRLADFRYYNRCISGSEEQVIYSGAG